MLVMTAFSEIEADHADGRRRRPLPHQALRSPGANGGRTSTVVSPVADVQIDLRTPGGSRRSAVCPAFAPSASGCPWLRGSRWRAPCSPCSWQRRSRFSCSRSPTCGDDSQANRSKDVTSAHARAPAGRAAARSALRGYVNTGDRRFPAHSRTRAGATRSDRGARTHCGRKGGAGAASRRLVTAVDEYVDDYAVLLIGIAELNAAAARSPVAVTEGRRRIEAIRRQVTQALTAENDLAAARVSSATSQANRAIVLGLAPWASPSSSSSFSA